MREGPTMYNQGGGGNLYQGNEFVPIEIVTNDEGVFAHAVNGYNGGYWIAMELNSKPGRVYAEECR